MNSKISSPQLSRRSFLQAGAIAGAAAFTAGGLFKPKEAKAKTFDSYYDAYNVDMNKFERFEENRTAFNMSFRYCTADQVPIYFTGASFPVEAAHVGLIGPMEGDSPRMKEIFAEGKIEKAYEMGDPGFTPVDHAYFFGAMESYNNLAYLKSDYTPTAEEKFEFESPEAASSAIKKVAKKFGADLVGICAYDPNFSYKTEVYYGDMDMETHTTIPGTPNFNKPFELDFEAKSTIVVATEMDYESVKAAGSWIMEGSVWVGYSACQEICVKLAAFLRSLGYRTRYSESYMGPMVQDAVAAGLGEPGRNSILITEEFGPRVRLAKIYTDLENVQYDKVKKFGVTEFCEVCQVCSDTCPTAAITKLSLNDPENAPANLCSQKGVQKYYCDAQKCHEHWQVLDNGCGICMFVCPYNKPSTWNHELVKQVTHIPGLNSMARYFDHFFGFGQLATDQELIDFWHKTI